MNVSRSLAMHTVILFVAAVLALRANFSEEEKAERHTGFELWTGTSEQVERVMFEHELGTMTIEPRQDKEGRYFVGTVVKKKNPAEKKEPPPPPHAADPEHGDEAQPPVDSGPTTGRFITVKEGGDLVNKLAPLMALRVLGKVDEARKEEFGFHKVDGKLVVKVSGKDHTLVFGGTTPGGSDRYAKDPGTGLAYVVDGAIMRDLMSADQRLVERKLHGWEDAEAKSIKLTVGSASRELVRNQEKAEFWSKPESPAQKDETASNWMSKVERLRVTDYAGEKLEPPPQKPQDVVLRIDYFDARKRPIGFLELIRRPGKDRPEYVAQTEHTRWFATVLRSTAEQIDQDTKTVVTP